MPNMFGGDQLDEDYAPTAYINHEFVGFDGADETTYRGKVFRFSTERGMRRLLIQFSDPEKSVYGRETSIDMVPKAVAARIRKAQKRRR